jgi:hypothetical protein
MQRYGLKYLSYYLIFNTNCESTICGWTLVTNMQNYSQNFGSNSEFVKNNTYVILFVSKVSNKDN